MMKIIMKMSTETIENIKQKLSNILLLKKVFYPSPRMHILFRPEHGTPLADGSQSICCEATFCNPNWRIKVQTWTKISGAFRCDADGSTTWTP